jgi:hypothetical protein
MALGYSRSSGALEPLNGMLRDADETTRKLAAAALATFRTREAANLLAAPAEQKELPKVSHVALLDLMDFEALIGVPSALDRLTAGTRGAGQVNENDAYCAIYAMACTRDPRAKEALFNILKNGIPEVRGLPPTSTEVVDDRIAVYADAEGERQARAVQFLVHQSTVIPDARTATRLMALLKESKSGLRIVLLAELALLNDPRIEDTLVELLADADIKISHLAARVLEEPGAQAALKPLFVPETTSRAAPVTSRAEAALVEYRKTHPAPQNPSVIVTQPASAAPPLQPVKPPPPPPSDF